MDLKTRIRIFICANLCIFEDETNFSDSDNIFELGYVNSLFVMKLLNYVETEFGIAIENDEMDINNFCSVNNIARLISRKMVNA